jgi:hypothetical protein
LLLQKRAEAKTKTAEARSSSSKEKQSGTQWSTKIFLLPFLPSSFGFWTVAIVAGEALTLSHVVFYVLRVDMVATMWEHLEGGWIGDPVKLENLSHKNLVNR